MLIGGNDWKIRFMPDMAGKWTFKITCSDESNLGLHNLEGSFLCTAPVPDNVLSKNGPIRVSRSRTHFMYDNESPFFWMADTAWNGPLKSNEFDWKNYLEERKRQGFTAVQWIATPWRGFPKGDLAGQMPFSDKEKKRINPEYFRRLDNRVEAINRAGLISVPVLVDHPSPLISESGIKTKEELLELSNKTSIKTFLIGESLLKDLDNNSIFSVL